MKYNFDEQIERANTECVKYDLRKELFGNENVIPLWVADMDFRTPDFVIEAMKKRLKYEVFGYALYPPKLYNSICRWVEKRHNYNIKSSWISFTPGIIPAISTSITAYTQPGDKILVMPPVYQPFFFSVTNNGRQLVENVLIEKNLKYEIDFEDLEIKLSDKRLKMLIFCSPHNPVGRVWTKEELERIGELCLKHDVILLSDEIHSDLIIANRKHIPIASLSPEIAEKTIMCIAPSKTFNMASLTASAVIISNEKLKYEFDKTIDKIHLFGNSFSIEAMTAAYEKGEEWLEQLLTYIRGNYNFLKNYIKKFIPAVKVAPLEGTYLCWLDFSALRLEPDELQKLITEKARLGLNDGRMFGKGGENFQRINIACPRKTLEKAVNNLKQAIIS